MQYAPLTLSLIEEGRFLEHADEDLSKLMHALAEHVKKYGKDLAIGAKAELGIKITLKFEGRDLTDYSVKTVTNLKLPGRPAEVTIAVAATEQTGEETLFVRNSGSGKDTPHQAKLATEDGRTIDPSTGKPKPKKGE